MGWFLLMLVLIVIANNSDAVWAWIDFAIDESIPWIEKRYEEITYKPKRLVKKKS